MVALLQVKRKSTCLSSSVALHLNVLLPYADADETVASPSCVHVVPLSVDFSTTSFLPFPDPRWENVTVPGWQSAGVIM